MFFRFFDFFLLQLLLSCEARKIRCDVNVFVFPLAYLCFKHVKKCVCVWGGGVSYGKNWMSYNDCRRKRAMTHHKIVSPMAILPQGW